jgi:hypothetical protein
MTEETTEKKRTRSGPIPMREKIQAAAAEKEAAITRLRKRETSLTIELETTRQKLRAAEEELALAKQALGGQHALEAAQ